MNWGIAVLENRRTGRLGVRELKATGLLADIKTAIRLLNGHIRSLANKEKVKTT